MGGTNGQAFVVAGRRVGSRRTTFRIAMPPTVVGVSGSGVLGNRAAGLSCHPAPRSAGSVMGGRSVPASLPYQFRRDGRKVQPNSTHEGRVDELAGRVFEVLARCADGSTGTVDHMERQRAWRWSDDGYTGRLKGRTRRQAWYAAKG